MAGLKNNNSLITKPNAPGTTTDIVVADSSAKTPNNWDDVRLQKFWLAVQRREWRSLALIGASPAVETLQVAEMLAQLAWRYRGQPSSVCDLRDLSMRLVEYQAREVQAQVESGVRLFIALRSIFENPTATPIAQQADAVVVCVALGRTDFKSAEQTINEVGRERVLGCIVVRDRKPSVARQPKAR